MARPVELLAAAFSHCLLPGLPPSLLSFLFAFNAIVLVIAFFLSTCFRAFSPPSPPPYTMIFLMTDTLRVYYDLSDD
jgi:hypothetical protein